jgi:hypothetical protein
VISLVCPTRYRPNQFAEMVASAADLALDPKQVQVVAYLDDDEPEMGAYRGTDHDVPVGLVVGGRCTLSDAWNRAAALASGDVLMLCADDLRFRTPGWDVLVADAVESVPDGICLVYGRDGHADERMATHPFVTRRWVDVVGRFTAPYFVADYVDLWLHDVASRVGRAVYVHGLLVEHMHPAFGKGEYDRNHEERLARARVAGMPALWDSLEWEREAEAARLSAAIGDE